MVLTKLVSSQPMAWALAFMRSTKASIDPATPSARMLHPSLAEESMMQ